MLFHMKPFGSTQIPLDVKQSNEIKDLILSHQVIRYASHNSDEGSDGLTGTNLTNKDVGEKILAMLDDTCDITEANREVNYIQEKLQKQLKMRILIQYLLINILEINDENKTCVVAS